MTAKCISMLTISSLALILSACGGSSGSSNASNPFVIGGGDPTFTPGRFEPAENFKNRCAAPRSGTNDLPGSRLFEKHWLRSWSNETYLWYDEIADVDPADALYPLPVDYFEILRTEATTASGAPRDQFHFTYNTEEYQELVNSGASAGYGARTRILDSTAPDREIVIAFVEAGSPADNAGIARGTEILEVDGAVVADGDAEILNAGLFPADENEVHEFLVRDSGSTQTRTVTMTSALVASIPVHTTTVKTLPNSDTVGYVLFNTFGTRSAEEGLFDAFQSFQGQAVDHLVVDMRYNGGGFLDIASELGYMIAGNNTTGRTFETLVFNDKHPTFNPVTGERLQPTPFYSTAQGFSVSEGTPLPTLNLDTVYILTTGSSCSATESLINSLEGIDVKVYLIGTTTCGKPYGFYATDNCGTTYFTIQFQGENNKGFGDYADGFSPSEGATTTGEPIDGCILTDDFNNPLGDDSEALYSAALNHIESGACPAVTSADQPPSFKRFEPLESFENGDLRADPRLIRREFLENNRILGRPE